MPRVSRTGTRRRWVYKGTEIWSTQQNIDVGGSAYRGKWGEHFPRTELEALRTAWREHRDEWEAFSIPSNP